MNRSTLPLLIYCSYTGIHGKLLAVTGFLALRRWWCPFQQLFQCCIHVYPHKEVNWVGCSHSQVQRNTTVETLHLQMVFYAQYFTSAFGIMHISLLLIWRYFSGGPPTWLGQDEAQKGLEESVVLTLEGRKWRWGVEGGLKCRNCRWGRGKVSC